MKLRLWIPAALFLLAGCASINYMGESYPPTQHVDLYFSEGTSRKSTRSSAGWRRPRTLMS